MPLVCPPLPAALANGLPPAGSAEWCAWIDDVLAFFSKVANAISSWINSAMDYRKWRNALNNYHAALVAGDNVLTRTWTNIVGWVIDLMDVLIPGADLWRDMLRCAWQI